MKNNQDGRILRSVKSQKLIVEAAIKLFKAGNFEPTAQLIANESGVGIRTVFRQFDDIENLLTSVADELSKDYSFEIKIDQGSSFKDRLNATIDSRHGIYKRNKQMMYMTVSVAWKYKNLKERYKGYQRILKTKAEKVLPEILDLDTELQHLFDATLSFSFWTRLQGQGMKENEIKTAMFNQCMMIVKNI